jgi:hypothetical protein
MIAQFAADRLELRERRGIRAQDREAERGIESGAQRTEGTLRAD